MLEVVKWRIHCDGHMVNARAKSDGVGHEDNIMLRDQHRRALEDALIAASAPPEARLKLGLG